MSWGQEVEPTTKLIAVCTFLQSVNEIVVWVILQKYENENQVIASAEDPSMKLSVTKWWRETQTWVTGPLNPAVKKRPRPHHDLPSELGAKGRASSLKAPVLVKLSEIASSVVNLQHKVSPDMTALIWEQNNRMRLCWASKRQRNEFRPQIDAHCFSELNILDTLYLRQVLSSVFAQYFWLLKNWFAKKYKCSHYPLWDKCCWIAFQSPEDPISQTDVKRCFLHLLLSRNLLCSSKAKSFSMHSVWGAQPCKPLNITSFQLKFQFLMLQETWITTMNCMERDYV